MSLSVIVIILLVIAMMLGPVMLMQPTPGQKRLARLRQEATKRGLKVGLATIEDETAATYRIGWPATADEVCKNANWRLLRQKYAHEIHFLEFWDWDGGSQPPEAVQSVLARFVPRLPKSIVAVEIDNHGVCCYWDERGGEKTLHALADWLVEVSEALWPLMQRAPAPDADY